MHFSSFRQVSAPDKPTESPVELVNMAWIPPASGGPARLGLIHGRTLQVIKKISCIVYTTTRCYRPDGGDEQRRRRR